MRQVKGLRRRVAVSAVILAAAPISLAASPVAASPPTYSLRFSAKLSGTPAPYHLRVQADQTGIPANLFIDLSRYASSGNHVEQLHEYSVNDTQTVCATLANCHVSDDGGLGVFGRISLSFSPTQPARSHNDLCSADHTTVLAVITERKGALRGTFRLNTGTAYFGSITNGSHHVHIPAVIPATASKYQATGNNCPKGPPPPCVAALSLIPDLGPGTDIFGDAFKESTEPRASMQFTWRPDSGNSQVEIDHSIFGSVPRKSFRITSNNPDQLEHVRANFNQLAPFVSGVATFNATDPPNPEDTCHGVDRNGTLDGPLTAHFDGFGTVHYSSGPALVFRNQSF